MPVEKLQNHGAVEKPSTKPGRKPIMSEPKNKRTAQNRAAQRAFRERKEKRMKELEDQVKKLEEEKMLITNESELLRLQVKTLLKSLNKNGGTSGNNGDIDDIFNSLNKKQLDSNKLKNDYNENYNYDDNDNDIDDDSSPSTNHDYSDDKNSNISSNISSNSSVTSNTPGSLTSNDEPFKQNSKNYTFNIFTPELMNSNINNNNNDINLELKNKINNASYKDEYNEKSFCQELNKACGSKSCPIPKSKSIASNSPNDLLNNNNINNLNNDTNSRSNSFLFKSPLSGMTPFSNSSEITPTFFNNEVTNDDNNTDNNNNNNKDISSFWNYENKEFINDKSTTNNNDEINLLFNESDKIKDETNKLIEKNPSAFQLVSTPTLFNDQLDFNLEYDFENDAFDDLLQKTDENLSLPNIIEDEINLNNDIDNNNNNSGEGEIEKVPDNTVDLMKCNQIWERITTHPRFTELDIDNLCDELKEKAKCSESGVVVNGCDVGNLLKKAMKDEQKNAKIDEIKQHDVYIKKMALNNDKSNNFLHGMW